MAFVKAGFSGPTCALAWTIKYVHYQLVQVAMHLPDLGPFVNKKYPFYRLGA